jgi:hypothetical protein
MRTPFNSWPRKSDTESAMTDGPFTASEAAVWNFLLFWCLGDAGADLETLEHWLSDSWSPAEIYIAIASLLSRGAIQQDEKGYYPMVAGQAYRNVGVNWNDILSLAVDPGRTVH